MGEDILRIEHLKKTFGDHEVLKDISFNVKQGEVISVIGSSGSGKSTILRCINLLEIPTSGAIYFKNQNILDKDIKADDIRTKISMVFQSFNLFENMSVLKNCTIGPIKVLKKDKEEVTSEAINNLKLVGMEQYVNAKPRQLSGGQKQRVAIARALTMHPECLLFDEPTSALDPEMVDEVLDVIKNLAKSGITMLIVTHEMQFAKDVSNRIIFVDDGLMVKDCETKEFFNDKTNERITQFLKRYHNN